MFGTSGIRGQFGTDVTTALALSVGHALVADGASTVVLGRDPRASGRPLSDALAAGVTAAGGDVIDLGMAATPTIARSVGWRDADAGVVITASHNPAPDNGIKLWQPSGQAYDEAARERISALVREESYQTPSHDAIGRRRRWTAATDRHQQAIVESVPAPAESPSVVVDVGNGAGGVTAGALRDLGCAVETLNAEPDGSFPSRPSEPTKENCTRLQQIVGSTDADLGIAHDGDADRMLAVDETGSFVSGDELLALFSKWAVADGDSVAVPVDTSRTVDRVVEDAGGSVEHTRVGDVFVAEAATDPGVVFGGEPSGAWIWPNETLCPDGPYAACTLASRVGGGSLAALRDEVPSYPLTRTSIETGRKQEVVAAVGETLQEQFAEVTTLDGFRVDTDDAWGLVRASGTQPLVRITAEGTDEAARDVLFETLESTVTAAVR